MKNNHTLFLQKELTERLKIPKRSLDKVLKHLREENKIHFRVRAGRNGGIMLASIHGLMRSVIRLKRKPGLISLRSQKLLKRIHVCPDSTETLDRSHKIGVQTDLFMIDTG